MKDARFVVWDPTGLLDDSGGYAEKEAKELREKLEREHKRIFRIRKEFPADKEARTICEGCVPPGTNPSAQHLDVILKERITRIDREIRIFQDKKRVLRHRIKEIEAGIEPSECGKA